MSILTERYRLKEGTEGNRHNLHTSLVISTYSINEDVEEFYTIRTPKLTDDYSLKGLIRSRMVVDAPPEIISNSFAWSDGTDILWNDYDEVTI